MTIVPNNPKLHAELAVPSSAIGFVRPGQTVHIAIDAFPYQRFGTISGRVRNVSLSTINMTAPDGKFAAVYPATVILDRTTIEAYGVRQPLVSGMTLTARIVTEKQSLWRWLFEPLFAVRKR